MGNADWLVKSNIEAREGFTDIIVETAAPDAGIIAELKYTKDFKEMSRHVKKHWIRLKKEDIRSIYGMITDAMFCFMGYLSAKKGTECL